MRFSLFFVLTFFIGSTILAQCTITQQPAVGASVVCLGGNFPTLTVVASGGAGLTYQWYSNSINSNVGGVLINGAISSSYTPTSNTVGNTYYYCIVSEPAPVSCSTSSSVSGLFTVNPAAGAVTVSPLSVTACGSQLLQASIGNNENIYWQGTTNNGTSTATQSSSQTVNSSGTYYFRAQTALGCWGPQGSTTVTINTPVNITQQPSAIAQTVCLNASFSALSVTATGTGLTYQWYSNSINSNVGGTLLNGATASSYTPTSNSVGTLYYYCIVNGTAPCIASTSSVSGLFTINPAAGAVTVSPLSVTACGSQLLQASIGTNENIYWQGTTNNGTSTATQSSSQTVNSSGTYYFRAQTALGCWGPQGSTTVTINVPVNITLQPTVTPQTVCLNGSFSALSVSATGTGLTYQWYSNSINSNVGGTLLNGATASSYTPLSNSPGTLYYYCIISGAAPCVAQTSTVSGARIVNAPVNITQQPPAIAQTVCLNASFSALSVSATGTGLTYQWYSNSSNSNLGGTLINGATSSSYTPLSNNAGTIYYYCIVSGTAPCSSQTSLVSGARIVNTPVNITQQPNPTGSQVCLNQPLSALSVSANPIGVTYQWYANAVNSNIGGTPVAGATSPVFTPQNATSGTTYYYCLINGLTACPNIASNVSPITIYPLPPVDAGNNIAICSGSTIALNATGAPLLTWSGGYQNGVPFIPGSTQMYYVTGVDANQCVKLDSVLITVNSNPIINAGNDVTVCSGNAITLNATGALAYSWNNGVVNGSPFIPLVSSVYLVTGTNANGCQGNDMITVTVNASPQVSGGANQSVCAGNQVILAGAGASTYAWNNNIQNNVPFTPITTQTYTVTGTAINGCTNTAQVTVTVNTLPSVSAGPNQTVCAGTSVTLNGSGALTYTWNNNIQNNVPFTPVSTQMYTVTGTGANGCSNTAQVTITVLPNPVVNAGNNQTICEGSPVSLMASGTASTYSWNNNIPNGTVFYPSQTGIYTVTGTAATGCQATDDVIVTVNPLPQVSGGLNQSVCAGNQVILTGAGANTYTWNNNVQNNVPFTPLITQTYTVTGTATNGCTNTAQVSVSLLELPNVNAGDSMYVCNGQEVVLWGSGAEVLTWNPTAVSGVPFIPNSSGYFYLTGSNANGCSAVDSVYITVSNSNYAQPTSLALLGINVLYAIDSTLDYYQWGYNFNGTSVLTCAGTHFCYFPDFNPAIKEYWLDHGNLGECYRRTYYNQMNALNETVFDEIKAMPVPFTSYLTIQTDHEQEYLLDVFTIQGERIMQTQFLDNVITLTTEHWAKGVYYIQLSSRSGIQRIHVIK